MEIMNNYYETGHAKNAANLLRLNQFIATLGANYNPSNNAIKVTALQTLYTNANTKLMDVNSNFTSWKNATNQRELIFEPLRKEATQILAALQSSGVAQQTIDDFAYQVRKFRGSGKKSTKNDTSTTTTETTDAGTTAGTNNTSSKVVVQEPPEEKSISTAQLSFDNKLQHFSKMILILQSVANYNPNENAFKVTTLQTQLTNMTNFNNAANTSYAALKNARIQRNLFFYAKDTGVLDLVKQVKAYIKSLYGAGSQQYLAVNEIKFTRVISKKAAH